MVGFLKRHRQLSVRRVGLIKRTRAAVSHEIVNDFFDEIEPVLAGVPPENILNFDETNLQENLGKNNTYLPTFLPTYLNYICV